MTESTQELASRWQRLWGALLDDLIGMAIVFPVMWISGIWQQLMQGEQASVEQRIWLFIFGVILFFVLQGYLLAKHGQTIGKRIVGTRIVSADDGQILPLSRIFWLRQLPLSLVGQISTVGQWLGVIDLFFIFRKDKRCIHDLIAGTKVIKVSPQSFGGYAAETSAPTSAVAGHVETKMSSEKKRSTTKNGDVFYDEVAKEMQENRMVQGVWARAFAEADGDENRAKAIYIKLRIAQLMGDRVRDIQEERQKLKKDRRQGLRSGFERAMFGLLGFASAVLGGIFTAGILGSIIRMIYSKEYRDLLSIGWFAMAFCIVLTAGFFVGARRCFKLSKAETSPKLSKAESCPKRRPLFR